MLLDHATGGTDYDLPVVQHDWEPSYTYPMHNDLLIQKTVDAGNAVLYNCKLVKLVSASRAPTTSSTSAASPSSR